MSPPKLWPPVIAGGLESPFLDANELAFEHDVPADAGQAGCQAKWLAMRSKLPTAVRTALDALDFKAAIAAATQRGLRDVGALTDILFYTKFGAVHGYCPIKPGTRVPSGVLYKDAWQELRKSFVSPVVGEPVAVLDLDTVTIDGAQTRLRYRPDGTFEGWFTNQIDASSFIREIEFAGRVRISDAIARRNYDQARDRGKWPLSGADIHARAVVVRTNGPTNSTAGVHRTDANGSFKTSTRVVFGGAVPRFNIRVDLKLKSGDVTTRAELGFVAMDLANFIARIDPYERKRPAAQSPLEFLASVRKIYQGGPKDPLGGLFDQVLYRTRAVNVLLSPDSAESKWLKFNEALYADGELVDIGHVLTGIEGSSKQRPNTEPNGNLQQWPGPTGRRDTLVTWAGDLGSVFKDYIRDIVAAIAQGKRPDLETYLKKVAGRADLVGDIDGINIGARYDEKRSLADNLNSYYPKRSARRFHEFVSNTLADDGTPALQLEPEIIPPKLTQASHDFIARRVTEFVKPLYGLRGLENKADPAHRSLVPGTFQPNSPQMRVVVDYFVRFLEDGLAREAIT
jgi:hypothetical protein